MCQKSAAYLRVQPEDPTVIRRFVPSTTKLQWVSGDMLRDPQSGKNTYNLRGGFKAAGKTYRSLQDFATGKPGKSPGTFLDIHGREILSFQERFPCFDSYDYLYENRYYRWFYIFDGSRLTEVYYADERPEIQVTEDVAEISVKWWPTIEQAWGKREF